jgi:hypothetical protein
MLRSLAALVLVSTLAACPQSTGTCDEDVRKQRVLAQARSWYLYRDLLPDPIDPGAYASAQDLLDALTATARDQGLDRGWSYLVSKTEYDRYARQALTIGFGYSWGTIGEAPQLRVLLSQVYAGSAAAAAGFLRGDELLALGPDADHLTPVAGLTPDQVNALGTAAGLPGVSRAFRVLPRGGSAPVVRTMVSAVFDVAPVPSWQIWDKTGYVQLRTFIEPAEASLRAAFRAFHDAGVQNVVVDLRYDGGGLLSTAEVLANLLAQDLQGKAMYDLHLNPAHALQDEHRQFSAEADGGTFQRIAFVTSGASASASELVPNVLDAYRTSSTLALVGSRTYGKPVGQLAWELPGCDTILFLISFRLENAVGVADYFQGLPVVATQAGGPVSNAPLCGAADDLSREMDDPAEASTSAAVYFVEHGACPPPALRAGPAMPSLKIPVGLGATPAERDMPGLL